MSTIKLKNILLFLLISILRMEQRHSSFSAPLPPNPLGLWGWAHTEKYLRHQQIHETLDLLALFEKPDTAKLVREVAVALMGGRYVNIPCAGGGSVSSETGWDGRKKDEENEDFRLRCWLHAAKTVKASRYVPTKRKGYGL